MTHRGDLVVVDEELIARGDMLMGHRDFFREILEEYIEIVDYLTANIEGETARSIAAMVDSIRDIPCELNDAGASYSVDCDAFVSEVDVLDSYLYGD